MFALLEDPEVFYTKNSSTQNTPMNLSRTPSHSNRSTATHTNDSNNNRNPIPGNNISQFLQKMELKYNIELKEDLRSDIRKYLINEKKRRTVEQPEEGREKGEPLVHITWGVCPSVFSVGQLKAKNKAFWGNL